MNEWIKQVTEFQEKFENPSENYKSCKELIVARQALIDEECREFDDAVKKYVDIGKQLKTGDIDCKDFIKQMKSVLEEMLDAICDMTVINIGTAKLLGFDMEEAMRRVHESNMSKLGKDGKPIYREDGKVLKGPDYHKPKNLFDCIDGRKAERYALYLKLVKDDILVKETTKRPKTTVYLRFV